MVMPVDNARKHGARITQTAKLHSPKYARSNHRHVDGGDMLTSWSGESGASLETR